ncbi:DNA polymerase III subunit delta [filamentous cyanobacterium CCP5]|nr:DNA polymerase III subunit delta [filamentous cyanobacterium CCP5]
MAVYFFWGNDEYRLAQAVTDLRQQHLDPDWASFNYEQIGPDLADGPIQALNQAMTPPFGGGKRFVWLKDTSLGQRCAEAVLSEFQRTLPQIPETTVLLLTSSSKPDGRAKLTKLLQKYAEVREFSPIPPWKSDLLVQQVQRAAQSVNLTLATDTAELLATAIGNDTRQLHSELEKLALFWQRPDPLPMAAASELITVTTQNSLQLASALRQGQTGEVLGLVTDLLDRNEPALRIVAVLVNQFRMWLWVKLMGEARAPQADIAREAEVGNPKRVYFLEKEVRSHSLQAFQQALPLLLSLEHSLKSGADERATLQTKLIELSRLFGG